MYYLPAIPNASGAYPGPRSNPEPDAWQLTDEQAQMVVAYNGFVVVDVSFDGSVVVSPDTAAWEAWQAEQATKEPSTPSTLDDPPSPPPTVDEQVAELEAENKLLRAQMSAQSDQLDFYEDCIAEMAAVVYA